MNPSSHIQSEQGAERLRGSSPIPHMAVAIEDTFWSPRLRDLRERTLFHIFDQFRLHGYFEHDWHAGIAPIPYVFWESDISKWLKAASYSLATHPDPELTALVDEAIAFIASFQQPYACAFRGGVIMRG